MNCRDGFSDQCWNLVSPNTGERRDPPTKTWCDSQRKEGYAPLDPNQCHHINFDPIGSKHTHCPNCQKFLAVEEPEVNVDEREYAPDRISIAEPTSGSSEKA